MTNDLLPIGFTCSIEKIESGRRAFDGQHQAFGDTPEIAMRNLYPKIWGTR